MARHSTTIQEAAAAAPSTLPCTIDSTDLPAGLAKRSALR
jgi:hypothetical protein